MAEYINNQLQTVQDQRAMVELRSIPFPDRIKHEGPVTMITDELPAMFPNFPTDKRAQVALELYTTECTYVRGLETVIQALYLCNQNDSIRKRLKKVFKMPLEVYLDRKELKTMFSNIDRIFQLHKDVVFLLCERITHWKEGQSVGDIFSDMASKLNIYTAYCNNYEAAEKLIKQKLKKKKEFEAFLNTCYNDPVCQPGLTLSAYLNTVIQRIPTYILLLRDLIKHTPPGHPDSRHLNEGFVKMKSLQCPNKPGNASEVDTIKETLSVFPNTSYFSGTDENDPNPDSFHGRCHTGSHRQERQRHESWHSNESPDVSFHGSSQICEEGKHGLLRKCLNSKGEDDAFVELGSMTSPPDIEYNNGFPHGSIFLGKTEGSLHFPQKNGTTLSEEKALYDDVFRNETSDSPLKPVFRIGSHSSFQGKESALEISRERYADGSPRLRPKCEGDIDDLELIYNRKQNTLPARVTSLKHMDVVEENTLIRKSSWEWLLKPVNLEESRERRDNGSPLIKSGSKISILQMGDESECHMDIDENSTNKVKTSELLRRQELLEGKMSSEVAAGFSEKGSLGLTYLCSNEVEPISGFETRMEAQNIHCADSEDSVDQHWTTETKLSLDDSGKTPDESKPRSSFKTKVVYEREIVEDCSSLDIEENVRHEVKQKPSSEPPTSERERLGNENDAIIPKSTPSDFESPSPSSNKVNMVQLRACREKLTPDQLVSASLHQKNSTGSPDKELSENLNHTGGSDKQSLESLDCDNTTPDVVKDATQQVAEGNEGSPKRPLAKVHSRSFNSPDCVNSLRSPKKPHEELFKLPRRSTVKPPVEITNEGPVILVTDNLPVKLPDFPTDMRAQVALELYTTERTYVRGLETTIQVFKMPLEKYLDPKELKTMFSNIDGIFKLNKDLLFLLYERIILWNDEQCIGDIINDMASEFKIYTSYCNNHEAAENLIKQKIKKKKEFEAFLNTCYNDPVCQPGLTLPAYLITVIQRIPRYSLLLMALIKWTPPGHPDTRHLNEGLLKMNNMAEYINNQLQTVQGQRAMVELSSRVIGIKAFENQGRSLFKEGDVLLTNTKKMYKCLLFNDLLVFASKNVAKQSEVELILELKTLWVADLEDNDPQTSKVDAIEVYTPEQFYTMYTGSQKQKILWLHTLRTAIAILLHGDEATYSYDITHRRAAFTYKDGRIFCGSFIDGKCNGQGVLAWQNRTRYVGNFEDDERKGIGELTYSTGEKYTGEWLDDRQHGVGTLKFPSGGLYTGEWQAGKMHGKGLIEFSNKDLVDGEFVDGEINGLGNLKCANGMTYEGTWQNSMKHGTGKLAMPNGDVYNGEFCDDQIHGQGEMVYARNKATYSGQWENNQRHGQGKMIYADLGVYEGCWFHNLRHGKGKMSYPDGATYDGNWELDSEHGPDGVFSYPVMTYTYQGEWLHGRREGRGTETTLYGTYEGEFKASMRHGRGRETLKCRTVFEGQWKDGRKHGEGTKKTTSGAAEKQQWKDGQLVDKEESVAPDLPLLQRR